MNSHRHTLTRPVRALHPADLDAVVALDAELTGIQKGDYWRAVLARFMARRGGIALGVPTAANSESDRPLGTATPPLDGFLVGEVRAFEFGSDSCGWIFSLGVRPPAARSGVASALVEEACARFARAGVTRIRTMVTRTDVPLLSLFRSQGFVGGPFVQLELEIPARTHEELR